MAINYCCSGDHKEAASCIEQLEDEEQCAAASQVESAQILFAKCKARE